MNFRRGWRREEPEINFIPLIDVLLVILIFLMVTTTYARFAELQITLPAADAEKPLARNNEIQVGVTADGRYAVDGLILPAGGVESLTEALVAAAGKREQPVLVINADAAGNWQSVVDVMEAARRANLPRIGFATQTGKSGTP